MDALIINDFWVKVRSDLSYRSRSTLKAIVFSNKVSIATINAIKEGKVVKYDPKFISEVFQTFFVNMTEILLQKFPPPPNKYGIDSVKKL